jgi:hypothetical protein
MKRPPTDLKFLETIYEMYYDAFVSFRDEPPSRSAKNYVPSAIPGQAAMALKFS